MDQHILMNNRPQRTTVANKNSNMKYSSISNNEQITGKESNFTTTTIPSHHYDTRTDSSALNPQIRNKWSHVLANLNSNTVNTPIVKNNEPSNSHNSTDDLISFKQQPTTSAYFQSLQSKPPSDNGSTSHNVLFQDEDTTVVDPSMNHFQTKYLKSPTSIDEKSNSSATNSNPSSTDMNTGHSNSSVRNSLSSITSNDLLENGQFYHHGSNSGTNNNSPSVSPMVFNSMGANVFPSGFYPVFVPANFMGPNNQQPNLAATSALHNDCAQCPCQFQIESQKEAISEQKRVIQALAEKIDSLTRITMELHNEIISLKRDQSERQDRYHSTEDRRTTNQETQSNDKISPAPNIPTDEDEVITLPSHQSLSNLEVKEDRARKTENMSPIFYSNPALDFEAEYQIQSSLPTKNSVVSETEEYIRVSPEKISSASSFHDDTKTPLPARSVSIQNHEFIEKREKIATTRPISREKKNNHIPHKHKNRYSHYSSSEGSSSSDSESDSSTTSDSDSDPYPQKVRGNRMKKGGKSNARASTNVHNRYTDDSIRFHYESSDFSEVYSLGTKDYIRNLQSTSTPPKGEHEELMFSDISGDSHQAVYDKQKTKRRNKSRS